VDANDSIFEKVVQKLKVCYWHPRKIYVPLTSRREGKKIWSGGEGMCVKALKFS